VVGIALRLPQLPTQPPAARSSKRFAHGLEMEIVMHFGIRARKMPI
jgi:hypothetical protein